MKEPIRRIAVLGAGAMGSGIAAHVANAGLPVVLLDIVPPNLTDEEKKNPAARNKFADTAMKNALKAKPTPFFYEKAGKNLVQTGNFEDDLEKIADCDLIIEAIIERLDIKRDLFAKVEKLIGPDAVVASNTSGLRIVDMVAGMPAQFRKNFMITHFFNPPRHMKLLELVGGPDTDPAVMERVRQFGEDVLGKGIVFAKDSPNFVANRIGTHNMMATVQQMIEDDLQPEDVDAICGAAMAKARSAVFRTADLVGLDVLGHVVKNSYEVLTEDEDRDVFQIPDFMVTMLEKGILGNKTRGGFYKKTKDKGILTFDHKTCDYRPKGGDGTIKSTAKGIAQTPDPGQRVRDSIGAGGKMGDFAWKVTAKSLVYAARRVGEICDSIYAIDDAMRWGFNWELGPFEVWDALGFKPTLERLEKEGYDIPESVKKMRDSGATAFYRDDGAVFDLLKGEYIKRELDPRTVRLDVMRTGEASVLANAGAEAWDLGDGVLGVTFKTKMNSLDGDVIGLLGEAVERAEEDFEAMVIANEGEHFCVGANLLMIAMAAGQGNWEAIRTTVKTLHKHVQQMKYAQVPIIAVPYGMTVGGGLEVCMASTGVQAAAETYAGLVEVGVGLIPGGAGTLNMLWRAMEAYPDGTDQYVLNPVIQTFKNIAMARVAMSGPEAQSFGYFRKTDGISFDRARQLHEAKARAIGIARSGYHPPIKRAYKLPGESGIATLEMMVNALVAGGQATEHDGVIARKLANVLCGGPSGHTHPVTEEEILELECEAFVSLCGEKKSQDRIQHMLTKNKPLRN